jgi:two-component system LytT family response regulator
MNAIKAIIIDDLKDNVELLEYFITKYCPSVEIVGKAYSFDQAIDLIHTVEFQVIFLDIKLDKHDGFDVIEKLHSSNIHVVFITAYEEYAIKAFKHNAVDYIVKPVGIQELKKVVDKLHDRINIQTANQDTTNFNQSNIDFIAIPSVDNIAFIKLQDILYLEADGRYTTFHLVDDKKVTACKNMCDYEEILDPSIFFRVHKTYIVNLNCTKKIHKSNGNNYLEFYNTKTIIPIARRRYNDLRINLNIS